MAQIIEKINEFPEKDIVELKLKGYIDGNNVKDIRDSITKHLNKNRSKIIIEMKNVEFVSANAWKTLNDLNKEIKEIDGAIKILNLKKEIEDIFHLLEYDKKIEYYRKKDKIIESFSTNSSVKPFKIKEFNRDFVDNLKHINRLSLREKIEKILYTYGCISLWDLKDILTHPVYNENVNVIKLYFLKQKIENEME